MENIDFATLFQGIGTMMESGWLLASARVFLVLLGLLLIYLGWKGVLEPMVMIPMGLGMVAINCGTLMMPDGTLGNLFLDPMLSDTDDLMNTMQIDFLQPVYTLTFSNGLIACFVLYGHRNFAGCGLPAPETVCEYIPCFMCRTRYVSYRAHRFRARTDFKGKRICCYGRWCGRSDGALYFAGSGKTFVCSYHGSRLPVFGTDVRRVSIFGQAY